MKVITAPEKYEQNWSDVTVFLAGGITNCKNWQQEVIDILKHYEEDGYFDLDHLVVFNPRREEFKVDPKDPKSSFEQIRWEHEMLEGCDIFSILFVESESVQPICMYELGKWAQRKRYNIISAEDGYKRLDDVISQTSLDGILCNIFDDETSAYEQARRIAIMYKDFLAHR